jgi:protein-tyrosine kinase
MSLIERAAKRLEELRKSGVDVNTDILKDAPSRPARKRTTSLPFSIGDAFPIISPAIDDEPIVADRRLTTPAFDIDLPRLSSLGYVTPENPRSRTAEEFRNLKRTLIANASGKTLTPVKAGNFVMVTSSLPGEGKTFSSINLAMSIAMELDRTIMLVDADVARPSLPRVLGMPQSRGLLDVLRDSSIDLDDVLVPTNVKRLTILPSGAADDHATELLASDAMSKLIESVAARYPDRLVLFDSPPLLPTTESRVLATHMGQIVYVVKAEHTLQRDVLHGLSMIEQCPVKMMLLNQATSGEQGIYGYGYGYDQ